MTSSVIPMETPTAPSNFRFTVDDYYRMADVGILTESDRVELLDGQVMRMSPIGIRHAFVVDQLNKAITSRIGDRAIIRVQNPVRLDSGNEPEPDISILKPRPHGYSDRHPGPEDVLLIIEVGHSSAEWDRTTKLPLYARFSIPEVWLFDLASNQLNRFRNPRNGVYNVCKSVDPLSTPAPDAFPDLMVDLTGIFPDDRE